MAKITVVGSFVTDMVANVENFPKEGETLIGKRLRVYLGGKGANQCVAVKRLGINAEMIGKIGNDGNGKAFIDLFSNEKIISDKIFISKSEPTAVAQIQIDKNSQNKIVVIPSANHDFKLEEVLSVKDRIQESDLVMLQLEIPMEVNREVIRIAKEKNIPIVLNPAPAVPLSQEMLSAVDYLTPNELELSILSGLPTTNLEEMKKAAQSLVDIGVKNVVATIGKLGALIANKDGVYVVSGYKVDAIDTVAAGDSFNGALAVAIVEEKSLIDGVKFANAMGALTVTKSGAIPSLHTREEVEQFIKDNQEREVVKM